MDLMTVTFHPATMRTSLRSNDILDHMLCYSKGKARIKLFIDFVKPAWSPVRVTEATVDGLYMVSQAF